jgi:hypothetical protein
MATPIFLQKTVLNVQITFKVATMNEPIPLNQGTGISAILKTTVDANIQFEKTATGDTSVALMPTSVKGEITLHPRSPALSLLQQTTNDYRLTGIVVPGVITVQSISNNAVEWSYSYTNVVIKTPFKGYDLSKTIDDYVFDFEGEIPDVTTLYQLANSAAGLISAV